MFVDAFLCFFLLAGARTGKNNGEQMVQHDSLGIQCFFTILLCLSPTVENSKQNEKQNKQKDRFVVQLSPVVASNFDTAGSCQGKCRDTEIISEVSSSSSGHTHASHNVHSPKF